MKNEKQIELSFIEKLKELKYIYIGKILKIKPPWRKTSESIFRSLIELD